MLVNEEPEEEKPIHVEYEELLISCFKAFRENDPHEIAYLLHQAGEVRLVVWHDIMNHVGHDSDFAKKLNSERDRLRQDALDMEKRHEFY